jgi:hypothetical protein
MTLQRYIVSPIRDVIVDRGNIDNPAIVARHAFGPWNYREYDVRPLAPHRKDYTEADAVAVCEYLNQRVTP